MANEYKEVYLFNEIPTAIRKKLKLGNIDHGIDLLLIGYDNRISAVQCKFTIDQNTNISWSKHKLANLLAEGDLADYFVIFTNASNVDSHTLGKKSEKLNAITINTLSQLSFQAIENIKKFSKGIPKTSTQPLSPMPHQQQAIQAVVNGFKQANRGQLILPCGAGKTLTALWIKKAIKSKRTIVLLPSLALLRQTKNEWQANSTYTPRLCVCSENDIDHGGDSLKENLYELTGQVSTNPDEIKEFLRNHEEFVIYSTYQSLQAVCLAAKALQLVFDLAICDEAHKTAGSKKNQFSLIHSDNNLPVKNRLYMTATPRIVAGGLKDAKDNDTHYLYDMNNPKDFGKEFYRMSFKEAIDQNILINYQIIAVGVDNHELADAVKQRKYVKENLSLDEIANNYALEKIMNKHGANHALTFHSSVTKAKSFAKCHTELYPEINTYHVNGSMTTNEREKLLNEFKNDKKAIITNARCLTEGVDVPAIDLVYFCDPKNSKIDIVQASGRALRKADHKNKKMGYIVVPIFHREKDLAEETIDSGPFKNILAVIRALSAHDERLVDEITQIKEQAGNRKVQNSLFSFGSVEKVIAFIDFEEVLQEALFDQIISKKEPWRDFSEAREFARNLNFNGEAAWRNYVKSGSKPHDIPVAPAQTYKNCGWISWGDWLGTNRIANKNIIYRDFEKAKDFVHGLKFTGKSTWDEYCKSGKKPVDIPATPQGTYKNKGWISWGDWLGTGTPSPGSVIYRAFPKAKKFVHALGLKNHKEWIAYLKSDRKPKDIPSTPEKIYKNMGWVSLGDWLGTRTPSPGSIRYRSFTKAKKFIHTLGLKNVAQWRNYCDNGNKPQDIPSNPDKIYKENGWVSMGDWLGTNRIATQNRKYKDFHDARKFVHSLKLLSYKEWLNYIKIFDLPNGIPKNPYKTYKDKEWKSWGDWLGTNVIAARYKKQRDFEAARKFVRNQNFKNQAEWRSYCTSGNKPDDILTNPQSAYKEKGWISMGDWLGTDYTHPSKRKYRDFIEAKKFTRSLGLQSEAEWRKFSQSKKRPKDIPATPARHYQNKGWISMGDWLGTGYVALKNRNYKTFDEGRKFARTLRLKNQTAWKAYCASGKRPIDIPADPRTYYKGQGWISLQDWLGTNLS